MKRWWLAAGLVLAPLAARADSSNFDLGGRIYTKWLYRNNTSQGVLTYGNPFWSENLSGDNGVGSEFELTIKGRVSETVSAGVRIQSRFGSTWHDFWENGNLRWTTPNTSGESLGMDHAEYMKLRGYWVKLEKPLPGVGYFQVGSSDLGMWNAWTVGKIRYIDRDNAKGIFAHGEPVEDLLRYDLGIIALPKLWVGPNWSTGIGENTYAGARVVDPFWSQDWAYALKLQSDVADGFKLELCAMLSLDFEADLADPDAKGTENPADAAYCREHPEDAARCPDHNVDLSSRYKNAVVTLAAALEPADDLSIEGLFGWSGSFIDEKYAVNGVALNQGMFPMVYGNVADVAGKLRVSYLDAFGVSEFNLKAEGFYIGEHWTSTFGARREDDVLLTDGFIEGGQLPSLNLANEFLDFDEAFVESCIGWMGGTLLGELGLGPLNLKLEATVIGYNTNGQHRRVFSCDACTGEPVYPTFLYSEGYTDVDLYDYANPKNVDRGRDPRSVFKEDQDRFSAIFVLWATLNLDVGRGLEIGAKVKQIIDRDKRRDTTDGDDYSGNITIARLSVSYPLSDAIKVTLGGQFDWWDEQNRDGSPAQGYAWYQTTKVKPFLLVNFSYGGATLRYLIEYLYKDQWRGERDPEQFWSVIRSKATLEVAW
jgi:hypothetical protein